MHGPHAIPGEIVPQAVCTRFGMAIGAYSSWLVHALIWLCWIVAFPISKILDYLLGHGQTVRRLNYLKLKS